MRPYSGYTSDSSDSSDTTSEEIENASVENGHPSPRNEKTLRNFDLLLPKFHFILPKFYFLAPWRNFVSSLEISHFLGRKEIER